MIAPDAHLVAHVRFDRLSPGGRCPDGSGFGRAPELVGGGRVVPDARFGRCLRLDGTGGLRYLDDPELRLDGSFSVELWVAPRLPVGKCVLVAHLVRAPGTRRTRVPLCELSLSDAGLGTRVLAGPVHATTVRFETPDWRHVAVTYDAGSKQCFTYVDGALAGIHVPGTRDVQGDVSELWIGTDGEGDLGFEGSVGTLRLYDRYRHASEIVEAMHDDRTPRADPGPPRPVVHLPFHDIGADGTSSDACWLALSDERSREAAAHAARWRAGPRTMPLMTCSNRADWRASKPALWRMASNASVTRGSAGETKGRESRKGAAGCVAATDW